MNTIELTDKSINDAYAVLGISMEKSESPDLEKSEEEAPEMEEKEDVEKEGEEKEDVEKGGPDGDNKEGEEKNIKKSEDSSEELEKSEETFEKSDVEELKEFFKGEIQGFNEKVEALGFLNKSLHSELEKANAKIEKLESQPEMRKSLISTKDYIEPNFEKSEEPGKKQLSLSQNKDQIHAMLLDKAGFDKGENNVDRKWAAELQYFEANRELSPQGLVEFSKSEDIQIVK